MWTNEQIEDHISAGKLLTQIIFEAFEWIGKNPSISEWEIQELIFKKFKERKLKTDRKKLIIAFNENAAIPHYYPAQEGSKILETESLILIDIWARLDKAKAPFSDITWVGYYGKKIPQDIKKIFNIVLKSRNKSVEFINCELKKSEVPSGKEIDAVARSIIFTAGYGENFIHSTGHNIGTASPHGRGRNINRKNNHPLNLNLGYTIEPGIYLKNRFGIRSEIDFYINGELNLMIATKSQKKLILI